MKICMVYNTDGHWLGVHVVEIVEKMAKHGVIVYLLIPKTERIPQSENIKVHLIASKRFFIPFFGIILQAFSAIRAFRRLAKDDRIDIIYMRGLHFALFFSIYRRFTRFKLVFEMNGISAGEQVVSHKWLRPLKFFIAQGELFAAKNATVVIPVTNGIKMYLERHGVSTNRITVVENGVNTELFMPLQDQRPVVELKKQLGIRPEEKVVVFVGTLYPWQGVADLIESAPLVLEKAPEARFLIVGDGPMKETLITLAKRAGLSDKVAFIGAVSYDTVPLYINAGDVCAVLKKPLASGYSPLKLYEYLACGRPVIATRTDGFELLEEEDAGLLVNPEDREETARAFLRFLKDGELRQRMGQNARKYVVKNHSWANVAWEIKRICENIVNDEKPSFASGRRAKTRNEDCLGYRR